MTMLFNQTPFPFTQVEAPAKPSVRSLSFVVKCTYDIVSGGVATLAAEQQPFMGDTPHMDELGRSLAWPDDLVPWKPYTDFFIIGAFHQPDGVPAPHGRAAFTFGPLAKELQFHGPRIATRAPGAGNAWSVTPAEPIRTVPLRWELSLGGLRDPRNPYGLGGDVTSVDGIEILRLPLIEGIDAPNVPANFAPVSALFEERRRKLGTRDQRWSLFRAPLPPDDFDPSHVNAAPTGQQAGDSPRGDEPITLVNLSPTDAHLTFTLPGQRVRVAVVRKTASGVIGEEVPMRIDTVAALPEVRQCILIWRGFIELSEADYRDEVLLAECIAEPLGAARIEPDLPEALLARWMADEEAERQKVVIMQTAARAEMLKLLPKANLPPEVAGLIEGGAEAGAIFDALEKHILDTVAAIQGRLPKP